jgi:hypothetical protein
MVDRRTTSRKAQPCCKVLSHVCGLRMVVRYHPEHGIRPRIMFANDGVLQTAKPICQQLPGAQIDQAVTVLVLKAINPASFVVALQVFELRVRQTEV